MTHYLPDWMQDAECAIGGYDRDLWFPEPGYYFPTQVKRICKTCPVKQQCLDFADQEGYDYGIWGGLTERERRQIKNSKKPYPEHASTNYKEAS